MAKEESQPDVQTMALTTWALTFPQFPWELDDDERTVSTPWAEKESAQGTIPTIPCLTVLIASWGLMSNSIILWLLGFQIKRGPFAVYLLNMTTADFFYLVCHIMNIMGKLLFSLGSDTIFLIFTEFCTSVSENLLVVMSMERCLSVLCPVWCQWNRPKPASAIVCSLIWALTALLSGATYFLCEHSSSSNVCKEIMRSSHVGQLLLFLLHVVSLALLVCVQCSRSCCPKSSSLWVLVILLLLDLSLQTLPLIIDQFNSVSKLMGLKDENGLNLFYSEADTVSFETEDDIDIFLSCLGNSANPFTYFFMSCFKKRRQREPLRVFLQRTLLDEEELEDGTEIIYGSPEDVTLTLWTQARISEDPMRADPAP